MGIGEHSNVLEAPAAQSPGSSPAADTRVAWWLWPNMLSLDAPAVAVIWLWAFGFGFGVSVPPASHAVLFLTVWLIYAADRLIDVARDRGAAGATSRHSFSKTHFPALVVAVTAIGIATATMAVLLLPRQVLIAGLAVAIGVGAYFGAFVLAGRNPGKEFACGVLFAAGVAVPIFPALQSGLAFPVAVAGFGFLCAMNCRLISAREDGCPYPPPFAFLAPILLCLGLWLSAEGGPVFVSLAAAAAGLFWLRQKRGVLSAGAFRVLADAVLLVPLPVVLFSRFLW